MATNPKMLPCVKCGTDEHLAVYSYDSGTKHVECDKCFYLGPGAGSVRDAIKAHNARTIEREQSAAALRQILADALAEKGIRPGDAEAQAGGTE